MFKKLLISDFKKLKRSWIWVFVVLGPLGVVLVQSLNFGLRYDYMTNTMYKEDIWSGLIQEVYYFSIAVIVIGMALITSLIGGMEHRAGAWKQLLSTPVKKTHVYLSKGVMGFILLLLSCVLLALGTAGLGILLQFGTVIPWVELLRFTFFPYLAALPFFAVFIYLAVHYKNQGVVIGVGILSLAVMGVGPAWSPSSWPMLPDEWVSSSLNVPLGIATGVCLIILASLLFAREDVNG